MNQSVCTSIKLFPKDTGCANAMPSQIKSIGFEGNILEKIKGKNKEELFEFMQANNFVTHTNSNGVLVVTDVAESNDPAALKFQFPDSNNKTLINE